MGATMVVNDSVPSAVDEGARASITPLLDQLAQLAARSDSPEFGAALGALRSVVGTLEARFVLLRDILDRTSDIVFAKHVDGRYALLNPRGAEVLGKSVEEVLGCDDSVLFSAADAERIHQIDLAVMASGEPQTHEEACDFGHGRIDLLVKTTVWRGAEREVRGVIGIAQDVTARRRYERGAARRIAALQGLASEGALREERLRRQLAAELHSGLGQDIALAKLQLARLRERVGAELGEDLMGVERLVEQADRSLREITYQISPPSLYDLGLLAALEWLVEDLARKHGIAVDLESDGAAFGEDGHVAAILYRATRELLLNVVTHSGASRALVRVHRDGNRLVLSVRDEGRGFDAADQALRGYGLFGIDVQLASIGGSMALESGTQGGTLVTLSAPAHSAPSDWSPAPGFA